MYKVNLVLFYSLIFSSAFFTEALAKQPPIRSAYDYVRINNYVQFPSVVPEAKTLAKGPDYQVGSSKEFWSWDLSQMPPKDVLVPSTCRAVGEHVYLFVADDQWGDTVSADDIPDIMNALEAHTPAGSINPDQGIVPNDISVFGQIPDALDGDPHLFVLLMEIKKYGGNQFDGFFNAYNQYPDKQTMAQYGYHSNEVEMITVNSAIRPVSSVVTLSIFAHELQHLIHWGLDVDEVAWVNESMSELAMSINGLYTDVDWVDDYLADPCTSLFELQHVHYGACQLFGQYLYERFGAKFISSLVADVNNGADGFSAPLAAADNPVSMDELLLDWASANVGDGMGLVQPILSYLLFDLDLVGLEHKVDQYPTDSPLSGSIPPTGAAYIEFAAPSDGNNLLVSVTGDPQDRLLARVIMAPAQGMDGSAWTAEPEQGRIGIPFSDNAWASKAYLILFALADGNAAYTATASVEQQDDGGVDAGVDAGVGGDLQTDQEHSDGGQLGDNGNADAGTDDGQDSEGCGCASGEPGSSSNVAIFAFLFLAVTMRRRSKPRPY